MAILEVSLLLTKVDAQVRSRRPFDMCRGIWADERDMKDLPYGINKQPAGVVLLEC